MHSSPVVFVSVLYLACLEPAALACKRFKACLVVQLVCACMAASENMRRVM